MKNAIAFICLFLGLLSFSSALESCLQCPIVTSECTAEEASKAPCLVPMTGNNWCLKQVPKNNLKSKKAIRKCVLTMASAPEYQCQQDQQCFTCNSNDCNSAPKITLGVSSVLSALVGLFVAKYAL